jgi:cytochrome c oxidase assembly factor CtaG
VIAALALGLLYGSAVMRARPWPRARTAAFGLGLVALAAALQMPDRALPQHMAQHMLLVVVAAPLLVLGAPHVLALRALRGEARVCAARLFRNRLVASPAVAFSCFTAVLLGTHLTPFFDYAEAHPLAHGGEHVLLLSAAILFWIPVLGAAPARRLGTLAAVGYLFAAMAPMGAIGASWGGEAGAIMWVGGGYALLAGVLAAVWTGLASEERRQRARETYGR